MHSATLVILLSGALSIHALPRLLVPGSRASQPTPAALNDFLSETAELEIRAEEMMNATKSALPSASVTLCTEPNFKGECAKAEWPVNKCIDLRDYAGVTESFLPATGFECLLMQNKCDANAPYADIDAKDVAEGSDLTDLDWIKDSESYICFTELKALQRFVRMSRLIVTSSKDVTVDA